MHFVRNIKILIKGSVSIVQINKAYLPILYDEACKKRLSNIDFLSRIIKSFVKECQGYDLIKLTEMIRYSQSSLEHKGDNTISHGIVYDFRTRLILPNNAVIIINVEVQNHKTIYNLSNRATYYISTLITDQYPTEFSHSHYDEIKKVYSIWIHPLSDNSDDGNVEIKPLFDDPNSLGTLINVKTSPNHPPYSKYSKYDEILTPISLLLTSRCTDQEYIKYLNKEYGFHLNEQEEIEMCNIGEGLIELGKTEGMKLGKELGVIEGKELGIVEGKELGIVEGRESSLITSILSVRKSLSCSIDEAMRILCIPTERYEHYHNIINQKAE